jgi:hypothetical protein
LYAFFLKSYLDAKFEQFRFIYEAIAE